MNKIILLGIASLFLQGCATLGISKNDEFSCDHRNTSSISGVKCLSASQVYEATHDKSELNSKDVGKDKNTVVKQYVEEEKIVVRHFPSNQKFENDLKDYYNRKLLTSDDAPIPLKTQQGVMRIWMAPWIDSEDQLHSGEFVFKNIVNSEWVIGARIQENTELKGSRLVFSKQKPKEAKDKSKKKTNLKERGISDAVEFMNKNR
jgi:conjugal transfer pilus assembly protein TraV